MGGRDAARGSAGGGELIPAARKIGARVVLGAAALLPLGAAVAYSAYEADRLPELVLGVGAGGCAVAAAALVGRRPGLLGLGLALVGAAYATFVALRSGIVDPNAPLIAVALYAGADLGFWAIEPRLYLEPRRIAFTTLAALGAGLVGSLVLVASSGGGGGVALEALGVTAAVLLVGLVAWLAARAAASTST